MTFKYHAKRNVLYYVLLFSLGFLHVLFGNGFTLIALFIVPFILLMLRGLQLHATSGLKLKHRINIVLFIMKIGLFFWVFNVSYAGRLLWLLITPMMMLSIIIIEYALFEGMDNAPDYKAYKQKQERLMIDDPDQARRTQTFSMMPMKFGFMAGVIVALFNQNLFRLNDMASIVFNLISMFILIWLLIKTLKMIKTVKQASIEYLGYSEETAARHYHRHMILFMLFWLLTIIVNGVFTEGITPVHLLTMIPLIPLFKRMHKLQVSQYDDEDKRLLSIEQASI